MKNNKFGTEPNKVKLLTKGNDLVSTQRLVLHEYLMRRKAYDEERLAAERTLHQDKESAQQELKITQDKVNRILEDVRSKFQDAKSRVDTYSKGDFTLSPHNNNPPIEKKDIEYYHEIAKSAHAEIQSFFNKYYSKSSVNGKWRWRSFWIALIFLVIGGFIIPFAFIISIGLFIVTFFIGRSSTESNLYDNFTNLEFGLYWYHKLAH